MPRGKKKSHKGGHRHFTSEDDLALQAEKARREHEWRAMKGIESDDDAVEGGEDAEKGAKAAAPKPTLSDEGSEEESDEDDVEDKPKGISHLIEIENPNRIRQKNKKVTDLVIPGGAPPAAGGAAGATGGATGGATENAERPGLSRREKEEIEKQQAKERYQKLHEAGKTDEARADLARLALIRKQREEAAKKRDEEKKAADDVKTAAEQRLIDKKQKAGAKQ